MTHIDSNEVQPSSNVVDLNEILKCVLKASLNCDGLAKGLSETIKALNKREAHLCILANNCSDPFYKVVIEALCHELDVPLLKVENNKLLGEWCDLHKVDKDGFTTRVVGCSCVAIKNWGAENDQHYALKKYILKML